jgi:hypothetical protein
LNNVLAWLEAHATDVLARLPATRDLSYLEVTLYCFVMHLEFRSILLIAGYPRLTAFAAAFGERAAARETAYAFDA